MTTDAWRWSVLIFVVAGASGGLYYHYEQTRPCAVPITYAIGTVDPRFSISSEEVRADAASAAAIWSNAAQKTLFTYEPTAKLKVNLIYDDRQIQAQHSSDITEQQAILDTARDELTVLRAQCLANRAQCDPSLESKVAHYNARATSLNAEVKKFNTTAGRNFEEGQFIRDEAGERINVFEFIGDSQLTRVLAHEFGHALGLGHNDDPKAIMYAQNESGSLTPTATDLAALRALCGT